MFPILCFCCFFVSKSSTYSVSLPFNKKSASICKFPVKRKHAKKGKEALFLLSSEVEVVTI